ncbi:MAG: alpha/beta hydrolase [Solirubrobacteraceae bacterium]
MVTKDLSLVHLIRPPKNSTQKSPLFLLIHGYGADEKDLFGFAEHIPEEFCVISIQATQKTLQGGYCWYEINFDNLEKFINIPQAIGSKNTIIKFIQEAIEAYYLDEKNIWLCGFSQGAILSYGLALSSPHKFKNIVCLSGYPDKGIIGEIANKSELTHLKFFVSHGKSDPVIPLFLAKEADELLKKLEVNYVYKEYPGGHGIDQENYYDLIRWINNNK